MEPKKDNVSGGRKIMLRWKGDIEKGKRDHFRMKLPKLGNGSERC